MQFSLCHSGKTGIQTSTVYPNKVIITDDKSLLNAVQYDHVGAEFTNHTRSNSNFIKSNVIVMDIDNDKTDNPNEWVTEENIKEIFIDYNFALVTSRNHMLSKGAMIARPKFHIYFPINETNDREAYVAMKEELTNRYQFFDDNAKDAARFFFGNPNAKVIWNDSWMTIDEDLLQLNSIEVEEDFDADFYRPSKGSITEGSRNSTMSVFAAKILKRLGVTQEARSGFDEQASRCEPPLEKSELDTIWGSAVRFYNRTIKASDDYIAPDSFNRPSLKPDDFSDIGEAGVLAREYGDVLSYTNATDYLTFNGQYWKEDKQLAIGKVLEFLKGKRLVIASEMAEGMRLNTAVVKQITSTDEIQAEKKYKDPFHFVPSHTLVLYTNHLPKVGANDEGTWRRLVVIPFNAKISGRSDIKNFADYLYDNAGPAILSWIIEGAEKAIKANFKTSVPKAVINSVKSYREANDWLGHFINESCVVGEKLSEKSGELYSKYRAYCLQNLEYTRSTTDFYAALNQAGYERKRTNKGNFIMGLSLKADDDDFLN